MTNRIDITFKRLKENNEVGFIGLVPASLPPFTESIELAKTMVEAGTNILMVHLPNFIPWMEGPVLQKAARKPRWEGLKREQVFEFSTVLREKYPELPLLIMTLYDSVFTMGQDRFLELSMEAGVDGFDIPNYPISYSNDELNFYRKAKENGIYCIIPISYEVATAAEETKEYQMLLKIVKNAGGFLFVMNAPGGKSGSKDKLSTAELKGAIERIKGLLQESGNPCTVSVVVGISTPDDVKKVVKAGAESFMIGSAYIKKLQNGESLKGIGSYISDIKKATYLP
ncbi:tryptophan synthase subunit alpha [candidate division WOR-3 bacterium]|nr:tryptophan synthase subunit alpha [candidate division WOR-3 bacterium]